MEKVREHFASRVGFLLAAVGSAVGLGLLWKFPYVIGENGGGLFIILFFACIFVIGIPVFIGEILLGRRTQSAAVLAFERGAVGGRGWRIGGYLGVASSFLIMTFYSVIAGWGMSYMVMSLNGFYAGRSLEEIGAVYDKLSGSGSISILWHFLFTLITMAIVMGGVKKGIEYWSKVMVRILFLLLIALFSYSVTLPGFGKAVAFIFTCDPSALSVSGVLEALGLAFMTMSLGQGIMISFGSYLDSGASIWKMSLVVASSVLIVAILAALTIFPVVFSFDLPANTGPGLVFKTLPYLFAQLPGTLIISTLFFALFFFTALTSAVPLVEVVATNVMERFGTSRKKTVFWTVVATFVCGLPSAMAGSMVMNPRWTRIFGPNFMDTINDLVSIWVIPLAGLATAIYLGWVMDEQDTKEEFCKGGESVALWKIWLFFIRWVIPVIIIMIMIQKSGVLSSSLWMWVRGAA